MSLRSRLSAEPWSVDFFRALREFERSTPDKPRIGESTVLSEEVIGLTQDPFVEFPASTLAAYRERPGSAPRLTARFLGYFGPQGALPLNTTAEAKLWSVRDPSFADFAGIFANRFLQLFFRAWADARPIAQNDRPREDRFRRYVGSFAGIGVDSMAERDSVEDLAKLAFAGLVGAKVKSASRLARLIRGVLGVDVSVEERVGSWLTFEPEDRSALGQGNCGLGGDAWLGQRVHSINDKIRVVIAARDLRQYRAFLPSGRLFDKLADLVFFYLGHRLDFDVKLTLPAREAPAARLGVSGELGWTAWISPDPAAGEELRYGDARFEALERRRQNMGRGAR